jgi:acetyl esterase/lipase
MRFLLPLLLLASQESAVRETRDLVYCGETGCAERKHKLDLYLPKGETKPPVVLWIHGGAWVSGDRAIYAELGRRFAEEGIGFAAASYRLSPAVKHPEHVKDCAKAFAWLHANAKEKGGDPDRLFVMGQSAGGHLSALLALDRSYLRDLKVPDEALKGAIPMSGVYAIPALQPGRAGVLGSIVSAFGSDPEECRKASPITYVKELSAPMLVLTETKDNFLVRPGMNLFKAAFAGAKSVEFADAEDRDHISIVAKMFAKGDDPIRRRAVEFVRARCRELDAAK